ncbi:MAG: NIPSNAP family protein [Bacteroidota bacterium]
MTRIVEIRAYNLKPNSREEFHRLVSQVSFPLMKQWNVDVVDFGPSPHDDSSYYLIRTYESLEHRQSSQDSFYGSADWRQGPREAIISLIESDTSIVIEMETSVIDALRTIDA